LGFGHRFDPVRGHLVTERDAEGRTTIPDIYAVGDCAGLGGAPAAEAEGVIAGLAAAHSLGFALSDRQQRAGEAARTALQRHRRFQAGLWRLFAAPRLLAELPRRHADLPLRGWAARSRQESPPARNPSAP
jgi:succinate dehydrogenase/fumarate reductase flavoprotein subunit